MFKRTVGHGLRLARQLLLAFTSLSACATEPEPAPEPPVVETATTPALRWLKEADRLRQLADRARDDAARTAAISELGAFADRAAPGGVTVRDAAETRRLLYRRAAELALDANLPDRAVRLATRALRAPGEEPSRRQLLHLVARAKRALGDEPGALEAERQALSEQPEPKAAR